MSTLTAAYTFNDGTGNVYDYSGNKVNLTPASGIMTVYPTVSSAGVGYDCLLSQSASGAFGPVGSYSGLTVFAYFQYNGNRGSICSYGSVFKLELNGLYQVAWSVWGNTGVQYTATASSALISGNWYTITGTWDPVALKVYLYINGALVANNDMPLPIQTTTTTLQIGPVGTMVTSLLNTLEIRNSTFTLAQILQLEANPGGTFFTGFNSFATGDVIGDETQINQAIVTWTVDNSGFYAYPVTSVSNGEYSRYGNIYNTNRQYLMILSNDYDGNGNGQHQILFPITSMSDYSSPPNKLAIDFTGVTMPAGALIKGQSGTNSLIDMTDGQLKIYDSAGNTIAFSSSGVVIRDGNYNGVYMGATYTTGQCTFYSNNNLFGLTGISGNDISLDLSALSATYTIQFPNKTGAQVFAMMSDLNAAILGLQLKPTADAATTVALPSNTYNNGTSGVGATLISVATTALPAIDSVSPFVGMIILVKNEATTANNGLYIVTAVGGSGHSYVLTRHTDMNLAAEFNGSLIPVDNEGSTNANTLWIMGYVSPFTVGTSAVAFSQVGGTAYTSGTGISISGTLISLASGVCTPGTYQSVTVDTYGRVTAGSALTNNYQTVQYNASSLTQRAKLNFTKDFNVTDDSGNGSTDIRLRGKSKLYQFYNY